MGTYVLVHGAWYTGKELEPVAVSIKAAGHAPFTPTIKGNRPGDSRSIGLIEAIESCSDLSGRDHQPQQRHFLSFNRFFYYSKKSGKSKQNL
jgi:hypothetical protein